MKQFRIFFALSIFAFVACETEETGSSPDENTSESIEQLSAAVNLEASVEEADNVLDDIAIYSGSFFGIGSNSEFSKVGHWRGRSGFFRECAEIETEETDESLTVTITFAGECEDENGNAITGVVVKTETLSDTGSENTMTITDMTINGYVINGTKTFTWVESNANGNPEMNGATEITIVSEEGTVTKSGTKTVEITEGADTDTWTDNVKTITGSRSYTGLETSFSMEITTPLVKPAACKFIVSGVKTYTADEGTTTLDYGDGTCDGAATMTLPDGTVEEVTLRRRRR
ncbi:MAG: hypothetical protein AAGA86_04600 [Bacteroidota bacterium]